MTAPTCVRCKAAFGLDACPVCDTLRCARCQPTHQVDTDTGLCHDLPVQRETLFGTADGGESAIMCTRDGKAPTEQDLAIVEQFRQRLTEVEHVERPNPDAPNAALVDRARRMSKAETVDPGDKL